MPPINSLTNSIPYLVLTVIFIVLGCYQVHTDAIRYKNISNICIILFFIFFGLRGFVGWDWYMYYPSFNAISPLWDITIENLSQRGDFGYNFYWSIIKCISDSYLVMMIVSVLIDCMILNFVFKRYSVNYGFSLAVFMMVSLAMEVDTLRNMKSIELFLLSLPYIEKRKPIKFFIIIILAILFHASAIIYIPFYYFGYKRIPKNIVLWLFIIGNIIFICHMSAVTPIIKTIASLGLDNRIVRMANAYLSIDTYSTARGISPSYIERTITAVLVLCFYNKILNQRKSNIIFMNLFISYFTICLYFSDMNIIFYRVGALFVISYWIIWPALLECIKIRVNHMACMFYFVSICIAFVALRSQSILYNYDNYLFGIQSYNERTALWRIAAKQLKQ